MRGLLSHRHTALFKGLGLASDSEAVFSQSRSQTGLWNFNSDWSRLSQRCNDKTITEKSQYHLDYDTTCIRDSAEAALLLLSY